MTVKSKVIKFQKTLGVIADGYFGASSLDALKDSNKKFVLNPNFIKSLPIDKTKYKYENIELMMKEFNSNSEAKNPFYIAYMLATAYHETAHTFIPLEEYGKGKTRKYSKSFKLKNDNVCYMNGENNDLYSLAKFPYFYYGRGFVQLTWFDNYLEFAKLLKVDLLLNPQLACDVDIATEIMIYGMLKGTFTGKKLSDYFKYGLQDFEWVNARRIINGTDKAELIANYAKTFFDYLELK